MSKTILSSAEFHKRLADGLYKSPAGARRAASHMENSASVESSIGAYFAGAKTAPAKAAPKAVKVAPATLSVASAAKPAVKKAAPKAAPKKAAPVAKVAAPKATKAAPVKAAPKKAAPVKAAPKKGAGGARKPVAAPKGRKSETSPFGPDLKELVALHDPDRAIRDDGLRCQLNFARQTFRDLSGVVACFRVPPGEPDPIFDSCRAVAALLIGVINKATQHVLECDTAPTRTAPDTDDAA